jgi:Flp pilus assembly protein TadD
MVLFLISKLSRDPLATLPSTPVVDQSDQSLLTARPSLPLPPASDFVGAAACTECHAEVARQYASHPMSRSLTHITKSVQIKDDSQDSGFSTPVSSQLAGSLRYYVEKRGDQILHHEVRYDENQQELYDQANEVHYELGSGQRGHSYLIDRGGLLFMSPVTWYSEKSRWDLSPGYARNNLRFERRVVDACVNCHSGRLSVDREVTNHFHSPPFLEEQIGCERCHGPGGKHIDYHRRQPTSNESDPIVNPERLVPHLRDAVCNQCHLQSEERILRYGRTEYDFRPGDSLNDIWTIFARDSEPGSSASNKAVSQTLQIMASRCYQKSSGRLGCIACHDPHASPAPEDRVEYYRSKCNSCHGQGAPHCVQPADERRQLSGEDSCIDCHMPRLAASDVPHTSQTDHRIPRKPSTTPIIDTRESRLTVFAADEADVPEWERQRARGLVMAKFATDEKNGVLAKQASTILEAVRQSIPNDIPVLLEIGTCYSLQGRPDLAMAAWREVLELDPENETALERLAILLQERREYHASVPVFDRLLKINPWRHDLYGRYALTLGHASQLGLGIQIAERGLELNPSAWQLHDWLADAYDLNGDTERAASHRVRSEALRSRNR